MSQFDPGLVPVDRTLLVEAITLLMSIQVPQNEDYAESTAQTSPHARVLQNLIAIVNDWDTYVAGELANQQQRQSFI